MVKILCASDTHGIADVGKLATSAIRRKADVLVFAGDIEPAYKAISPEGYFYGVFMEAVRKLMHHCIEVVVVPGNHDFFLNRMMTDDPKKRLIGNLHILVDRSETVCGLKFYGTPWCPYINGRWCYEEDDEKLFDRFMAMPKGIDVLVSHSPPYGKWTYIDEKWDVSTQYDRRYWEHFGSLSLGKAIIDKKPKLVVCGHIHSGDHIPSRLGRSVVVNASLVNERYVEAYRPAEIMFGEDIKFREGARKWTIPS